MSIYGDYIKELRGDEIIENRQGFVTYRFINDGKTVYVIDVYIKPEFRNTGAMRAMADEVVKHAKERGCVELWGTVVPYLRNSTISVKALLGYGLSLHSSAADMIVFRKDI
jgi:ribosomal protein S18 acetylase RimI-like enzyme